MKKSLLILVLGFAIIFIIVKNLGTSHDDYSKYFNQYLILKPDNYNDNQNYPLLFMLHGHAADYKQWNEIVDLKFYANKYNFIIVCPDGHYDSWYVDSPIDSTIKFESYFFNNLVPQIFNDYKIDLANIFITGLSMGGHGAINLFLNHPQFFKSAGSTSGILDLLPFPTNWEIKNVLGDQEKHRENWIKYSAIYNLDKIKNLDKKFIVDCGTEDFAYDVNRRFRDSCEVKGIKIKFIQTHGNHSYDYWAKSIPTHFKFFAELVSEKN
jgi:putative tributyrin esterase